MKIKAVKKDDPPPSSGLVGDRDSITRRDRRRGRVWRGRGVRYVRRGAGQSIVALCGTQAANKRGGAQIDCYGRFCTVDAMELGSGCRKIAGETSTSILIIFRQ